MKPPSNTLPCSAGCGCWTDRFVETEPAKPAIALCIFCEDGIPCPAKPRAIPAAPATTPKGTLRYLKVSVPAATRPREKHTRNLISHRRSRRPK